MVVDYTETSLSWDGTVGAPRTCLGNSDRTEVLVYFWLVSGGRSSVEPTTTLWAAKQKDLEGSKPNSDGEGLRGLQRGPCSGLSQGPFSPALGTLMGYCLLQ